MKHRKNHISNIVKVAVSTFVLLLSALGLLLISTVLGEPVVSLILSLNKNPFQQVSSWFLLILVAAPIIAFWLLFFIQFEVAKENIVETLVEKDLIIIPKSQRIEQGKEKMTLAQQKRSLFVIKRNIPARKHL